MAEHDKENTDTALQKVKRVIGKKASTETLYELLLIGTPTLKLEECLQKSIRNKAFDEITKLVHLVMNRTEDTSKLLQDTSKFYVRCCVSLASTKKRKPISNSNGARASKQRKTSGVKSLQSTNQLSLLVAQSMSIINKCAPPTVNRVPSVANLTTLSVAARVPPVTTNATLSATRMPVTTTPFPPYMKRAANSALPAMNLLLSVSKRDPPPVATNASPSATRSDIAATTSLPITQPATKNFPDKFHVAQKWAFVNCQLPRSTGFCDEELHAHVAALCYNSRGAIAHGQETQIHYTCKAFKSFLSVESIFDHMGGTKRLLSDDSIKKELMESGPVVSTSFVLSHALLANEKYSSSFLVSRVGKNHEVVIIGWMLTAAGEFWLVKSLDARSPPVPIAFGHFRIEACCLSPIVNFTNTLWQNGPYFDGSFSSDEWMSWPSVLLDLSAVELQALARCFETGLLSAFRQGNPFVIRDKSKFAHSRRYRLMELTWNKEKSTWTIHVEKV